MISGVWLVWVWSNAGFGSFFCHRGETNELYLVLATGVKHVSFVWSGYRGETYKLVALITVG
jgi:hypothetical protein